MLPIADGADPGASAIECGSGAWPRDSCHLTDYGVCLNARKSQRTGGTMVAPRNSASWIQPGIRLRTPDLMRNNLIWLSGGRRGAARTGGQRLALVVRLSVRIDL